MGGTDTLTGTSGSVFDASSTSFDVPTTDQTIAPDIVTADAATSSGSNDGWGAFLKSTLQTVTTYSLQKDAAKTQLALRTQAQQAGITLQGTRAPVSNNLLLIGAIVGVVMLVKK